MQSIILLPLCKLLSILLTMVFIVLLFILTSASLYFIVKKKSYREIHSNTTIDQQQDILKDSLEEIPHENHKYDKTETQQPSEPVEPVRESIYENMLKDSMDESQNTVIINSEHEDNNTTDNSTNEINNELNNDISRIIDIIHNLSFLANDHQALQSLSLITKQFIDSYTFNNAKDILSYIEEKCEKMLIEHNEHTICYDILSEIVCLIKNGKTNIEIIDLFISRYNGQINPQAPEASHDQNVNTQNEYNPTQELEKASIKYSIDHTYGNYIAALAHKHKASLYANTIIRRILEDYNQLEDKPSIYDYIISQCNSRINGNLKLNDDYIVEASESDSNRKSHTKRPINTSHYKASELNIVPLSGDKEIDEIIKIIDKCSSMRFRHIISPPAPFNTTSNPREYQNDDSWIVFKDFILDKYDVQDNSRFSILYQIIRFITSEMKSGKSATEIITALKTMSIERLKSHERQYVCRNSLTAETKPYNDIIYPPDIMRFLSICHIVSKKVHIPFIIRTAEKLSSEYMLLNIDINFDEFISKTIHNWPITNDNQGMARCCFVKYLQSVKKNLSDEEIINIIIKAISKCIQPESLSLFITNTEHVKSDKKEINPTSSATNKINSKIIDKGNETAKNEPNLAEFIVVCSSIANLLHISKKFNKLDKVAIECCKKYNQGKKEISFFSFICAISFEDKYKGYKEVYQRILKLQKGDTSHSEIIQTLIKERLILLEGMTSTSLIGLRHSVQTTSTDKASGQHSTTKAVTTFFTIKQGFQGAITHLDASNKIIFSEGNLYFNKKSKKTRLNALYSNLTLTISSLYIAKLENYYGIIHCTDTRVRCVINPIYDSIKYNSVREGFELSKGKSNKFVSYITLIRSVS